MSTQLLLFSPLRKAIKTKKKKESWKLQGRYQFQGLPISVENKTGSYRRGQDGDGHKWKTFMYYDYGYVRNTLAKDGDAVDVYVNKKSNGIRENYHGMPGDPETIPTEVYVVHQKKIEYSGKWPNGICPDCKKHHSECTCPKYYDEDKAMLGFDSKDDAVKAYLRQYDSKRFLGPVSTYTIDEFKAALKRSFGKKLPSKKPEHEHWYGYDLDGTLAKDDGWKGKEYIGEPIEKTRSRIEKKLEAGQKVKIFTARASDPKTIPYIKEWLKQNNIPLLEITNKKDPGMVSLEDDRAVQVRKNTGNLVKAIDGDNDIRIVCTEDAAISLAKILATLQKMGNHGASRSIEIAEYGRHDFDGDGSAKIDLITINGQPLKKFISKKGEIDYPVLKKFIKSYGVEMEKACSEKENVKSAGPISIETLRKASKRVPKNVVVKIPSGDNTGINMDRLSSAFGVDFEMDKAYGEENYKSMLGTAETAGDPGVMYSFLRENLLRGKGKKKKAPKMPKDQVTMEDFAPTGENSPETARTPKKVVVKGILYKSCGKSHGMDKSYDTNEKYGGHEKSAYWGSVLMSPDEYKMEEARKNREETRRSREAMETMRIYPQYDMYSTLEKAEDDYEMMVIDNKEIPAETKHDYVVRMMREASGGQVDDMLNNYKYSEMYKAFVRATTRHLKSGKVVSVKAHTDARRKQDKSSSLTRSEIISALNKDDGTGTPAMIYENGENNFSSKRITDKMALKLQADGIIGYAMGDQVYMRSDIADEHNESWGRATDLEKAFVKAHTRKGKRIGPYFTNRTKKITTVKHTKLTGLDLSGKDAKEKIKALHKKKEHHDLHIDAATEMKAKVEAHKQSGNTTYKVGEKEHHVDKVLKDLNDHVKHHKNEITSHDNHINKIEKRHETVAKQWEEKKKVKKEAKGYDKAKAIIRDTLGSDKLTEGDVHRVMLAAKKKGDDSYALVNNFLMGTRPDLKDAVNQAGIKLDAMPDAPKKADVIDQMIKDGEHEGEKFSDDLMGVLKRMNGKKPERKVVVKKKEITPVGGIKESQIKSKPNHVYREVISYDGKHLGMTEAQYDGTKEGVVKAAKEATREMYEKYDEASNINSRMIASGKDGRPKYSISPNYKHVSEFGTKESAETLGMDIPKKKPTRTPKQVVVPKEKEIPKTSAITGAEVGKEDSRTDIMQNVSGLISEIVEGRTWSKGETYRIYLPGNRHIGIEKDKSINIDQVKRQHFEDVKNKLESAGYDVHRGRKSA